MVVSTYNGFFNEGCMDRHLKELLQFPIYSVFYTVTVDAACCSDNGTKISNIRDQIPLSKCWILFFCYVGQLYQKSKNIYGCLIYKHSWINIRISQNIASWNSYTYLIIWIISYIIYMVKCKDWIVEIWSRTIKL